MKREVPTYEFWLTFIGGMALTLIYFFDFKTDIMTRVDRLETKMDILIKNDKEDDVTTVFNTKVPKRADVSGTK